MAVVKHATGVAMLCLALLASCGDDSAAAPRVAEKEFAASCIGIGEVDFDPPAVLCIGSLDGTVRELNVALDPGVPPALSPGRDRIAVVHLGSVTVHDAGGAEVRSLGSFGDVLALHWQGTTDALLLQLRADDGAISIVSVQLAGGDAKVVMDTANFDGAVAPGFAVDPDGARIAYATELGEGSALVMVDLSSGQSTTLLETEDGTGIGAPSWSPDGESLAVVVGETVEVLNSNGGERVTVASLGAPATTPTWSPGGRQLLFVDARGAVVKVGVDGSELTAVVDHTTDSDGRRFPALPAWT